MKESYIEFRLITCRFLNGLCKGSYNGPRRVQDLGLRAFEGWFRIQNLGCRETLGAQQSLTVRLLCILMSLQGGGLL